MDVDPPAMHQATHPSGAASVRPPRPTSPDFPPHPAPEMPAWLTKCLKLLVSRTDEAADELGKMMDEALEKRLRLDEGGPAASVPPGTVKVPQGKIAAVSAKPSAVAGKKADVPKVKPVRTEPSSPKKVKRSPSPPPVAPQRMPSPEYLDSLSASAAVSTLMMDYDTLDVVSHGKSWEQSGDMEEDTDLSAILGGEDPCIVCGGNEVIVGNGILKCNECHKPYHQLCHRPKVAGVDPADPRLVWNCTECEKKLKKFCQRTEADAAKNTASHAGGKSKGVFSSTTSAVGTTSGAELFKRVESKPAPAVKPSGAAGLAKLATEYKSAKGRDPKADSKRIKLIDHPAPPRKS